MKRPKMLCKCLLKEWQPRPVLLTTLDSQQLVAIGFLLVLVTIWVLVDYLVSDAMI